MKNLVICLICVFFLFTDGTAQILQDVAKAKDKNEIQLNMYDSLTPRWRHFHTPEEIAHWYYKSGFGPICLTHFDNKYGFGAYAMKSMPDKIPGDHYDKLSNIAQQKNKAH